MNKPVAQIAGWILHDGQFQMSAIWIPQKWIVYNGLYWKIHING
jgi:hypothetical protein